MLYIFLLSGTFYFHRESIIEFLKSMESEKLLMSSIKQDVKGIRYNGKTCNWALIQMGSAI